MSKSISLGEILEIQKETLNPSLSPESLYDVFSIPGYDKGSPEKLRGFEIKSNKFIVKPGSILVSKLNPRIPRVWKVSSTGDNSISSTEFVVLKPKHEYKDFFDFVYSILSSEDFSTFLCSRVKGTSGSHQRVKPEDIYDYKISLNGSQSIRSGEFIKAIDEKIELNRQMNETLEQMAQALFRRYFIDNTETKEWESGVIGDLGEIVTGKTPSKANPDYYGNEVMFLKVPDMHSNSIIINTEDNLSRLGADSQSKKYVPRWSTCISCIATVGVISLAGNKLQTNQQINSIVPKNRDYTLFNYYLMQSKSQILKTMASGGSTTPNLNKGHFESIKIDLPPTKVLKKFQSEAEELINLVDENIRQIQTLTTLRATLLPRLIVGRINTK